ncbi:MAG: hypothetical protein DCE90_09510 [Pseudanabaena sp.]|nr:MAG: hypothetical protein DCE90_09510 [Pseudanabaena sp.]
MASNNNNQQKGSGADNSDTNKSMASDASDVDWMIMSDLGTKISGFTQIQKTTIQSTQKSPPPDPSRTNLDDDLEDLEWLQSIGLDAEIERSPIPTDSITGASTKVEDNVENIDWLIVSDLKQRIDDSEIKARAKAVTDNTSQPPTLLQSSLDSLDDSLNSDLDFADLNFSDGSDLLDLEDLGFDTSDAGNNLDSSSFDSISSDNEQDLLELSSFLEDNFDLDDGQNDFEQNSSDDWQSVSSLDSSSGEFLDNQFEELTSDVDEQANQLFEDAEDLSETPLEQQLADQVDQFDDYSQSQTDSQAGLAIFSDSFEMETQISAIASVSPEYEPESAEAIAEVAEEIYAVEEVAEELTEQSLELQDVQDVFNSEALLPSTNDLDPFDNSFGEMQDVNLSDAVAISDEVWSNSAALDTDPQSFDDAFAGSWEVDSQGIGDSSENNIDVSDDSIWGGVAIDSSSSDSSISNTFEMEDAWHTPTSSASSEIDIPEPSADELVDTSLPEIPVDQSWSAELEAEISEIDAEISTDYGIEHESSEEDYVQDSEQNFEQVIDAGSDLDFEKNFSQNSDWLPEPEQVLATDNLEGLEEVDNLSNWQESIEAESAADYYADELDSYNLEWEQAANGVADSIELSEFSEEMVVESNWESDNFEDNNFDFEDSLESVNLVADNVESWAIAEDALNEGNLVDDFIQEELTDNYENLAELTMEDQEILPPDPISVDGFDEDFDQGFAAEIADQITDSGFGNGSDIYPAPLSVSETSSIPNTSDYFGNDSDSLDTTQADELENLLNEDFDLATFDDDSLIAAPLTGQSNVATTLTPVRSSNISSNANNDQQESLVSDSDEFSLEDEFEKAIANDSLEDEFAAELEIEESLANELLNGNGIGTDFSPNSSINIPPPSFDTSASGNSFATTPAVSKEHDFLDDFDLDSIGTGFDSDEFDSDFASPVISTGLTPPPPPAPLPSPTLPNLNSSPPPPPFMLPLPPMRGNAQPKQQSNPSRPLTSPSQVSGSSANLDDRNFDSFHNDHLDSSKFKNNKSISSIDEGWSDLLDADTVLSDVLPSSMDARTGNPSQMGNIPPRPMPSIDNASQGRSRGSSSPSSRRKQPRLPDFEELGLEVHDDDNDWSGLLESGDLSDNITTISNSSTSISSRGQQTFSRRADSTSISETREIPRDRRPQMPNFGDATQARMSAPPDQIDFNRFTEDNYEPSQPLEASPRTPKVSIPSFSIESLWQNYLKFPAIGLGAIGAAVLLYTVMNRPVFELGLRWGIFKDARGLDFANADFRGAKLDNVDFSKAILTKARMQDASLEGANFQDANLDGVSFAKANLNQAKLVGASVIWSEFRDAQMRFVDLSGADITRSNFTGANLNGASFRGTKIGAQGTDKATKLPPINLLAWQIVNQPLEGRNLSGKNLSALNLSFSNLKRANLSRTRLNFTDLAEADLRGANLTGGQIDGANLNGAQLNGINLTGVRFDKSKLPKTNEQTICPDGKNGPCKF